MKTDAYIENAAREGKLLLAAALSAEAVPDAAGRPLHCAAVLPQDSPKRRALLARLAREPIAFFLRAHARLERALGCGEPLVIVTDWTDPSEVVGLRLQDERGQTDAPDLCFLALETNWEDLDASGIEEIFGHELSHLWLHRMGYRPERSPSNRFHTSTAITDPYLAFFEGFAESLEILSAERMGHPEEEPFTTTDTTRAPGSARATPRCACMRSATTASCTGRRICGRRTSPPIPRCTWRTAPPPRSSRSA